jgi:heme/copper-type cytochrome/quinol oxidase subunit 1
VQPYLWFLGMVLFSFREHVTGFMGMRADLYDSTTAPQAQIWQGLTRSRLGGVVLFASAGLFVMVIARKRCWQARASRSRRSTGPSHSAC